MDSILESVKKQCGMTKDYTHFDVEIIMHINSIFFALWQMGIGPETPFTIEDDSAFWSDFTDDKVELESVKTYVGQKCRLVFDPPTNSVLLNALNANIAELEGRLFLHFDMQNE